jgi:hypothetical protein
MPMAAEKPDLALLLGAGKPIEDDDGDDEGDADDGDAHADEVVSLLDQALDGSLSASERYSAFAEAIALCGD